MPDIKIKRYANKENLKKLMRYIKATFANKSEVNEEFYTKEQIDSMLESGSGGGGTGGDYYTKSEIDTKLNSKVNTIDLSNYYTKSEVDNLLSNAGSDKYGEFITAKEAEGGDDTQGGLSFYIATERASGSDETSQITIAEDANTVEDE